MMGTVEQKTDASYERWSNDMDNLLERAYEDSDGNITIAKPRLLRKPASSVLLYTALGEKFAFDVRCSIVLL